MGRFVRLVVGKDKAAGRVIMNRHNDPRILRDNQIVQPVLRDLCGGRRDAEPTGGIFAAAFTNRSDKGMIQCVDGSAHITACTVPRVGIARAVGLVHPLKNQSISIITETETNLLPQRHELRHNILQRLQFRAQPGFVFMMHIEDHAHSFLQRPINHFLHPVHPRRINNVIRPKPHVQCPRRRHTQNVKPRRGIHMDHFPGGNGIVPSRFPTNCVQTVSQIDSDSPNGSRRINDHQQLCYGHGRP